MSKVTKKVLEFAKQNLKNIDIGIFFEKFSNLLPVNKLYEDDEIIAFWHPKPIDSTHIILTPKKAIKNLSSLKQEEMIYITYIFNAANELVNKFNLEKHGYSLIINGGPKQEIQQLHFHLLSSHKV